MLRSSTWIFFALLTLSPAFRGFAADDPKAILLDADRARGGLNQGLSWDVKIETTDEGSKSETSYRVRTLSSSAYVEVASPARSKGEVFLFNDRTIWFFKPTLKKPVAISARQKLSGQAANGDIATTNYARDYSAKIVREEKLGDDDCFVLELKSSADNTTYDGIRYWVSKKRRLGLKAEFLSLEGKTLKSASFQYGNSIRMGGKSIDFVKVMTLVDAQNADNRSVMTYSSPAFAKNPESLFNVNNLLR